MSSRCSKVMAVGRLTPSTEQKNLSVVRPFWMEGRQSRWSCTRFRTMATLWRLRKMKLTQATSGRQMAEGSLEMLELSIRGQSISSSPPHREFG